MRYKNVLLFDFPVAPQFLYDDETREIMYLKKAIQYIIDKSNGSEKIQRKSRKSFTTGLLTIGAYLQKRGYAIKYLSYPTKEAEMKTHVEWADAIFFTAMTPVYPFVKEIIQDVRRLDRTALLVLGGYHASALPEKVMTELPEIDIVIIGEGEIAAFKLLNDLENSPSHAGLAVRRNGKLIINQTACLLDAKDIPAPDYVLLPGNLADYRFNVQMTRGCIERCKYCVNGYFWKNIRQRGISSILGELLFIESVYGSGSEVHITDNILTLDLVWLRELIQRIDKRGIQLKFSADIKAEYIDEESVELLKALNVQKVFIGIEDVDQDVLDRANRKSSHEVILQSLQVLKKNSDIIVEAYWLMGLPGTTEQSVSENIGYIEELVRAGYIHSLCTDVVFVPLPGTPLFDQASENGLTILHHNWKEYHRSNYLPVYQTDELTQTELRSCLITFERELVQVMLRHLHITAEEALVAYFNDNEIVPIKL